MCFLQGFVDRSVADIGRPEFVPAPRRRRP
jgi:hypothetical protein